MNKQTFPGWIFPLVLLVILVSGAASLFFRPARQDVQAGVIGLPVQQAQGEFETVMEPRELIFPPRSRPAPRLPY